MMSSSSLLSLSPEAAALKARLDQFVQEECQPAEVEYESHMSARSGSDRWTLDAIPPCMMRLKNKARQLGLWNLFLPHPLPPFLQQYGPSLYLSFREYGILSEVMGRSFLAPEACNCSAPDTGNMEVLLKHGSPQQQELYLEPLLTGTIRSTFLMTEPDVASSDATNIQTKLTKIIRGDNNNITYRLNGKKWWSTGAMDPRCKVALVLVRMDYSHPSCRRRRQGGEQQNSGKHGAHTVVLVPMEKITLVRPLTVFGYDDAPVGHAEVELRNIELDESSLILGEGMGFAVVQSRLGPGRIHHCMRSVGLAARCYELMLERTLHRKTFGKYLWQHGGCQEMICDSATDLEAARLLTLQCAAAMDAHGVKDARDYIAMIKVAVPELTSRVVDRAVQVFGGAGLSGDFVLARALAGLRSLKIADGPDAVHKRTVALMKVKKAKQQLKLTGQSRL